MPNEFGVFVRSAAQIERAQAAVGAAGLSFKVLDEHVDTTSGHVSIGTMHLAKGLEFRAVAMIACDDEVIRFQERIETVGDDADLRHRAHLLYVACTRARDHLLITGVNPASQFLDDLQPPRVAGPLRARDVAILAVLYGAGLRRSELVQLDVADVRIDEDELRVPFWQGKQERLAFLPGGLDLATQLRQSIWATEPRSPGGTS